MARVANITAWSGSTSYSGPLGEIGHFLRKDGVRSNDICLLDLQFTDAAKAMLKAELSKLLDYEAEGSGI